MITIGCAGFPVAATRYFKEFAFVEIQETLLAQQGTGTLRRWRREAPGRFEFALLAPREIGQEGFREGKVTEVALKNLSAVARELDAHTMVFVAPPDFTGSPANPGNGEGLLGERPRQIQTGGLGGAAGVGRGRRPRSRIGKRGRGRSRSHRSRLEPGT